MEAVLEAPVRRPVRTIALRQTAPKSRITSARLSYDTMAKLSSLAIRLGMSKSEVIAMAIERLGREEEKAGLSSFELFQKYCHPCDLGPADLSQTYKQRYAQAMQEKYADHFN